MVLKKKKSADVEKEPERTTVVTQVVEVVGEEGEQEPAGDIPPAREEHEEAMSAEAQAPEFILSESEVLQREHASGIREEHQKETVAELFRRPSPVMPEIAVHREKPKRNTLLLVGGIAILVALLFGGIVAVKGKSLSFGNILFVAPTPTPTPAPTPTPTPEPVNRADIKIQVWNGGGVPGAASKMKSFLEEKGYKVEDVSNADAYTYDKTEVQVKEGKESILKLLTEDLKDTYTLATNAATLSSDVSYDARVVVGKE